MWEKDKRQWIDSVQLHKAPKNSFKILTVRLHDSLNELFLYMYCSGLLQCVFNSTDLKVIWQTKKKTIW